MALFQIIPFYFPMRELSRAAFLQTVLAAYSVPRLLIRFASTIAVNRERLTVSLQQNYNALLGFGVQSRRGTCVGDAGCCNRDSE